MNKPWLERSQKLHTVLALVFFLAAVTALCLLLSKITVYSDDYHFGAFFRDGFGSFLDKTAEHYGNSNGRLFVHFLLELTLVADTKAYLLLCPLAVSLTALLLPGIMGTSFSFPERWAAMGGVIFLLIGLPVEILRESFLWISGAFNYMVPMVFVFAAAYFQKKYLTAGKIGFAGLLFALLAGATTEQFGFFACIVLWGMAIMHSVRTKESMSRNFILPLLAVAGYLTVLLAPGTWLRVDNESSGILAILDPGVLVQRFSEVMGFLTGAGGGLLMLVLFCLASASLVFAGKGYSKLFLIGYPLGIMIFLLAQVNTAVAGGFFLLYLVFSAVLLVRRKPDTEMGCLLFGGLGTQLMVLLSGVYGFRTGFPLLFILILASVYFALEILRRRHWLWYLPFFCVIFAVSMHWYVPTYRGYAAAKVVIDENLAAIKEGKKTGEIHLSMDVDEHYGYTSFYPNDYFYTSFLKYYDVDLKTTQVFVETVNYPSVYVNGEQAVLPALGYEDGTIFLPLAAIVSLSGGSCTDLGDLIRISDQDRDYWLSLLSTGYALYEDKACTQLVAGSQAVMLSLCGSAYLRADFYETLFEFEVTYDKAHHRYDVTALGG